MRERRDSATQEKRAGYTRASGEDTGSWWMIAHVDQVWREHVK